MTIKWTAQDTYHGQLHPTVEDCIYFAVEGQMPRRGDGGGSRMSMSGYVTHNEFLALCRRYRVKWVVWAPIQTAEASTNSGSISNDLVQL